MKHRQLILHGEHLLMSSRVVNKNQAAACILFWAGLTWILVAQFWQYFLITMVGCNCYFAWTSINQKAVQSDFFPNTYFIKRPTIILGTFQIQTSSKLLCKEESIFNNGTLLRELGKYHSPHLSDGKQEVHREAGADFPDLHRFIHNSSWLMKKQWKDTVFILTFLDSWHQKEWQIQSLFENHWFWVIKAYCLKCTKWIQQLSHVL